MDEYASAADREQSISPSPQRQPVVAANGLVLDPGSDYGSASNNQVGIQNKVGPFNQAPNSGY